MKKITSIFFILFLVLSSLSFAQTNNNLNQTDEKGQKQGYWKKYYNNGNIQYEGEFKNNKPVGVMKRYSPQGYLKAELKYIENSQKIYAKFFYPNQNIEAEGLYIGKLKDSIWQFYTEDNYLINKVSFKLDKKHGLEEKFYLVVKYQKNCCGKKVKSTDYL